MSSLCPPLWLSSETAAFRPLLASKVPQQQRPVEPSKEDYLSDKYEEDEDEDSQAIVDEILKTIGTRRRVART